MRVGPLAAVANHRGVPTPRTLGLLLVAGGALSAAAVAWTGSVPRVGMAGSVGMLVVFAVGLLDDAVRGGPRGLRGHVRALRAGHLSTGVLKALAIVGASLGTASTLHLAVPVTIAAVALLAGSANLANGLDVRPGRALKVFAPLLLLGLLLPASLQPAVPGLAVAALAALQVDLRERAMLGDGGANLLGFAGGIVLLLIAPGPIVPLLAAAVVAANILAETVGLSTLIGRSRALTAIDRWGRVPDP